MNQDEQFLEFQRALEADPENIVLSERLRAHKRRIEASPHFAVMSCIHGNQEALEAVFSDMERTYNIFACTECSNQTKHMMK